ncbi:MAG: hypothetical protein JST92_19215 [Deltaproteobacteria bacterium]|nr:hypothetical protein [Deltaproteobacteria bacterium]
MPLSDLEKNILRTKGVTDAALGAFGEKGIGSKADFATIGDAATLSALTGLSSEVASAVMTWAVGAPAASVVAPTSGPIVVDGGDVVYCVHCKARQPKDYSSGDLCPSCGKQAEPILACFWCGSSGPGKFCRGCGGEFVPTGELDLAVLLKRDGLPKDEIPKKLRAMSAAEKDVLWGRVRKSR